MEIKVLGKAIDYRTSSPVVYAQMTINDYLELINDDFDDFRFQRKRTNYSPYQRMKDDIKAGALLPPITLAIKSEFTGEVLSVLEEDSQLERVLLQQSGKINILDGLQRTYILKDIQDEGFHFNPKQTILLEFWVEKEIKHLIYRLIVLNAGQKKMSMRHQIELLFLNIKESLEKEIPHLIIHTQKDSTRRNIPKKFALDRLVMGYQSFLLKNTEVKRSNIVAQEMLENNVLDSTADELGEGFEEFKRFLKIYVALDDATYKHYAEYWDIDKERYSFFNDPGDDESILTNSKHWFASENVMICFFAAISKYISNPEREDILVKTLEALVHRIQQSPSHSDPLGLYVLYKVQEGIDPRKQSVDYQTRQILFYGFLEFFKMDGAVEFTECWQRGAL
ncbi:hypothetical protein AB6A23_00275 [Paenibacillus tarimensis]